MLIAQQINDYISKHKPAAFCDNCVAEAVHVNHSQANHTTRALGTTGDFDRAPGTCSTCHATVTVIARA